MKKIALLLTLSVNLIHAHGIEKLRILLPRNIKFNVYPVLEMKELHLGRITIPLQAPLFTQEEKLIIMPITSVDEDQLRTFNTCLVTSASLVALTYLIFYSKTHNVSLSTAAKVLLKNTQYP